MCVFFHSSSDNLLLSYVASNMPSEWTMSNRPVGIPEQRQMPWRIDRSLNCYFYIELTPPLTIFGPFGTSYYHSPNGDITFLLAVRPLCS